MRVASASAAPDAIVAGTAAPVAIELRHVTCGYGRTAVLRDVSVRFPAGAVSAVVGPNGCGKSTLVRCVCGAVPVRAGRVLLAGADACGLARRARARMVAVMPQGAPAADMLVEQLVLGGRYPHLGPLGRVGEHDRQVARDAMERAGCLGLAARNVRELSGGERQRAYLALVLAQQAPVVVLDEPTAYLDPAAGFDLMGVVGELRSQGVSVVMVLHDLPLAFSHADYIAVMRAGVVEAFGGPGDGAVVEAVDRTFGLRLRRARCEAGEAWCVLPRKEMPAGDEEILAC